MLTTIRSFTRTFTWVTNTSSTRIASHTKFSKTGQNVGTKHVENKRW